MKTKKIATFLIVALGLLVLPLLLQQGGNAWVRIVDMALLYVLLALGLNIVVGYAGLLDLGYVAFFAVGAYLFALLGSPHLAEATIPMAAIVAACFGLLLGFPVLKLRGDYLAIVTLGFGEIIRVFLNNLDRPINLTNGPKGINQIDSIKFFGFDLGKSHEFFGIEFSSVSMYYYLFLALVIVSVIICDRLQKSRIGRAWMAIREDEIAAKAMGINTRNMKLLAFGMGATFGGVSGSIGHLPGVILGALLLAALPEVLRHVAGPLQAMTDGRLDSSILRQLLIALAMIIIMLMRPRGLWPSPEHGKSLNKRPGKDPIQSINP